MTLDTLRRLGWPLLAALILSLAGGQLVWLAQHQHQASRQILSQVEAAYQQGHGRLQQAIDDEARIRAAIGRFHALTSQGVVGPEQRLEWIERLRGARERLRLPALEYELRPRQPLAGGGDSRGGLRLTSSTMRLRATLVTEEDLPRLLAELQAEPSAIVRPDWCRIAAAPAAGGGLPAECELAWITVEPQGDR